MNHIFLFSTITGFLKGIGPFVFLVFAFWLIAGMAFGMWVQFLY